MRYLAKLTKTHGIPATSIRRFNKGERAYLQSLRKFYGDIQVNCCSTGRRPMLQASEESTIADAIKQFADHNTPLKRCQIQDLVTQYVGMLPNSRQQDIEIANNRPFVLWVDRMAKLHGLEYEAVRIIDQSRVESLSQSIVAEHIARVQDACDHFRINDSKFILNMVQSGASFEKLSGKAYKKGMDLKKGYLCRLGFKRRTN